MIKEKDIYYDATFQILAPHRGMATYLNSFLAALSLNGENIQGLASPSLKGKEKEKITYYGINNILLWEQFSIPQFIKKEAVGFFIFPYNTGPVFSPLHCKSVLILHDLIFMEPLSKIPLSKSFKQIIGRVYRRATVPRIIKKTDFIITVSEFSKRKMVEHFKIKEDKITVIPNCIDFGDEIKVRDDEESVHYFLNVGGDAPHKNTAFLIRGYSCLPAVIKEKYSLKIVGIANQENKTILLDLIRTLKEESNIFMEEFIDEQQLIKLYREAFLFIFPSLSEGFGIPLLEAMKYGCSVVCSNTSSMPEVCKRAAFYFDPNNTQSFIDAVCLACDNKELRLLKKEESVKQVRYYSRQNFNKKVVHWFSKNIRNSSTGA